MAEEGLPRLGRVERILGEDERARGRRRPGVDERQLHEIEVTILTGEIAARLVDGERDLRVSLDMTGKIAEDLRRGAQDVAVHLDARHRLLVEDESGEDVASAADPHDEHVGVRTQIVGDVRHVVAKIASGFAVSPSNAVMTVPAQVSIDIPSCRILRESSPGLVAEPPADRRTKACPGCRTR